MQSALEQFRVSIRRVRDLIGLHTAVQAQAQEFNDVSDLLRAGLVLAVSALDYYVHEAVTLGMLEIHRGQRAEPLVTANTTQSAFARFQVSLGGARQDRLAAIEIGSWLESEIQQKYGEEFLDESHSVADLLPVIAESMGKRLNSAAWLEDEIRERLSYQSFQQADKIAEAFRYISDQKLWDEIAIKMGRSPKEVKQQLNFIVDRRNKIAHEADIDPTYGTGNRWEIDDSLVSEAVDFIEQLVESIHQVVG
jgi:cell fate (sporulation/competence/biofilm development) regulator YmcA (YheA/YmcA/DUF963 family)